MNGTYTVDDLPVQVARYGVTIDQQSGCIRSRAPHDHDGYARVGGIPAHRIVYREVVGPIPAGLVLDHVKARGCTWRDCINPAHLEPVTNRVNTLRGESFAAVNAAKEACDHGHPFDLLNTYYPPDGRRQCRTCNRAAVARYRERKTTGATLAMAA